MPIQKFELNKKIHLYNIWIYKRLRIRNNNQQLYNPINTKIYFWTSQAHEQSQWE